MALRQKVEIEERRKDCENDIVEEYCRIGHDGGGGGSKLAADRGG